MAALIRRKALDAEIAPILDSVEQAALASGLTEPILASTDVLVTSICYVGSKSLSHVLSCIERCKDRLLAIGPASQNARQQIITSVMDYWKYQTGVGVNIVDKLLNYTILTPTSVIEWALADHVKGGTALSEAWVHEMVSSTMGKVTNRVRQIVVAMRRPGLPEDQVRLLKETLDREMTDMKRLFTSVADLLAGFAEGSSDRMIESDRLTPDEYALIRAWAARWLRVFQRKYAVEENWINEELSKPLPEPEPIREVKMVAKEESRMNGQNGGHHFERDEIDEIS